MKIRIGVLRRLLKENLLAEAKCPSCGSDNAYTGLNNVECPNRDCDLFHPRAAEDVRVAAAKAAKSGAKIVIPAYIHDILRDQGIEADISHDAVDDAIRRDGRVPSEEQWEHFVDSTEDEMCPTECQDDFPEVAEILCDIFLPPDDDNDSPINRWNTGDRVDDYDDDPTPAPTHPPIKNPNWAPGLTPGSPPRRIK